MMGVNDLTTEWISQAERDHAGGGEYWILQGATRDLSRVARDAWHRASEVVPRWSDTHGVVPLVMVSGGDGTDCWDYRTVQEIALTDVKWSEGLYWARIRDVVLLPEGNNG